MLCNSGYELVPQQQRGVRGHVTKLGRDANGAGVAARAVFDGDGDY